MVEGLGSPAETVIWFAVEFLGQMLVLQYRAFIAAWLHFPALSSGKQHQVMQVIGGREEILQSLRKALFSKWKKKSITTVSKQLLGYVCPAKKVFPASSSPCVNGNRTESSAQ